MVAAHAVDGTLEVPVVDLTAWYDGTPAQRAEVARAVDRACRETGFMQVTGHRVPEAAALGLASAIDDFFAQDMADKKAVRPADPAVNRGYSPPRAERLSHSLGIASPEDLFEAFNIGSQVGDHPETVRTLLSADDHPDNLWPVESEVPNFRARVQSWFTEARKLSHVLTDVFALALDLPEGYFEERTDRSIDVLRMNNYRLPAGEVVADPRQMGMGAHTDYGIVTVLWADSVPGLQILGSDGGWHDVQPLPGALLVNLGDALARWTNERWLSTMHRVLPPTDATGALVRRRSAAFFHDGNADTLVEPLPACVAASDPPEPKYAPVTIGEHLRQKLAGSRGLALNPNAGREVARIGEE
ncbi:2OG-Fe(II) oxygenase [Streptomyces spiroverticillatus]|uniref:2OG-Fe(II) oxygenase n=1 Tax=Streptomyces finlayi TaxID=67296 RepID=A0A918WV57_9ACTN|nr:isopenicillin N synthase family oxygenase [Streptomyces finlayi]GHA02859.1 2OG-Fe(II) oxygenase [Streptomyces spiroverticillatus]GHC87091.1 2OG-Fe(II) oxygenase [Streptomyces finlayi]